MSSSVATEIADGTAATAGVARPVCGGASLLRKTGWSAASALFATASRFITGIAAARMLGPGKMGRLAITLWALDTITSVAGLGLQQCATRFMAEFRGSGREREAISIAKWLYLRSAVLSIGVSAVLVVLKYRNGSGIFMDTWALGITYYLVQTLSLLYGAYLAGLQSFRLLATVNAISGALLLSVTLIATPIYGVSGALLGYLTSALPGALLSLSMLRARSVPAGRELRTRIVRYAFFTWAAMLVSSLVWSRSELFFLQRYCSSMAVAMFTVGSTLATLAAQGPLLLMGPLLPYFSERFGAGDTRGLGRAYSSGTRLLALMLFPMCLGLASILPSFLPLLYGQAYAAAVPTAIVLAAFSILNFSGVASALLYGMERPWFIAAGGAVGAILSIAAGFLVIRRWGPIGAAWARSLIQLASVGAGMYYTAKRTSCVVPLRDLAGILLAASVASLLCGLSIFVFRGISGLPIAIAAAVPAYLQIIRKLRVLHSEELDVFRRLVQAAPAPVRPPAVRLLDWIGNPI